MLSVLAIIGFQSWRYFTEKLNSSLGIELGVTENIIHNRNTYHCEIQNDSEECLIRCMKYSVLAPNMIPFVIPVSLDSFFLHKEQVQWHN